MIKHKLLIVVATLAAAFSLGLSSVSAAKGDQGVDWSVHNGAYGSVGYSTDNFAIAQIGGQNGWGMYGQSTYESQVASGIQRGLRMHTYIWWEDVTSYENADAILNNFLPQVTTPKGSIVAIDVEAGAQNTDVIMHALDRIKQAGYTPMVYGYKDYLLNNTDLNRIADTYPLWLAEYLDKSVTPSPNYNYFPDFKNVAMFQFTSTYAPGAGLDGNVDLTGITDNGYTKATTQAPTKHESDKNEHKEANATTVSFKNVYVVDQWVQYNGKWYGLNYDMAKPNPIDYNQLIPVESFDLTDRYGNHLDNQTIQGNNGAMEFATFDGKYKILDKSADGKYIQIEMNGEPVWLSSNYVSYNY